MKTPTEIHVDNISIENTRCSVGWNLDGARFHFWMNYETKQIERGTGRYNHTSGTLYKNPLLSVKRGEPGHYNPVSLDAGAKAHAKIIKHILEAVADGAMVQAAIANKHEENLRAAEEVKERIRQNRIEQSAPELLDALKNLVEAAYSGSWRDRRVSEAKALIEKLS